MAAEDVNHPNPYMFTGRRFDVETGLYYYRARYYNPYVGRFLQTDPVGYGAGMNWYAYCGNNPLNYVDPSGLLARHSFLQPGHPLYQAGKLTLAYWEDGEIDLDRVWTFDDLDGFYAWASQDDILVDIRNQNPAGWELSQRDPTVFLAIKALEFMYVFSSIEIAMMEDEGWTIVNNNTRQTLFGNSANGYVENTIYWDPDEENYPTDPEHNWNTFPAVAGLAHEMGHALDIVQTGDTTQESAIKRENSARYASRMLVPGYENIWPRPLTGNNDLGWWIETAWKNYFRSFRR